MHHTTEFFYFPALLYSCLLLLLSRITLLLSSAPCFTKPGVGVKKGLIRKSRRRETQECLKSILLIGLSQWFLSLKREVGGGVSISFYGFQLLDKISTCRLRDTMGGLDFYSFLLSKPVYHCLMIFLPLSLFFFL